MLVGQQFGPFTIDAELGSGAMGTVYRGRYTKTGQIMAIKIMAPGIGSTNAAAADRFEREIAILKQLNHPNIVRFYGAGKHQRMRYFAMELIDGESLDKVMGRRGRMTWEEVVQLGQQLCSALQHAHEQGIIHRDLKPSNIMVLPDSTLKLTDFGIAKATDLEALTATNCTVGTASYMSPEQCKGQSDLTHKSDLYSLGVLFYELVTGRKPFKADSAMEMFMQHVNGTFERPSRLVLDIPVWLDTLICQLLEKSPDQRPLDAHMVSTTLGTIQEKVEAQQSAGVDAVRRRLIDRAPGQKRLEEEDKDAARVLITGKGKRKRKRMKKAFYQKVWFQAVGLTLALAFVGTLLYLLFRPPSPEKLYERAEKLMKAGNEEAAYNGPIKEYFGLHYNKQIGPLTEQMIAWRDQHELDQGEKKLRTLRDRTRNNKPYPPQEGEEKPFEAALAEDDGEMDKARQLWQDVRNAGSLRWSLVAANHLRKLDELEEQDEKFEKIIYKAIWRSGKEPSLEGRPLQAFLAWRMEHTSKKNIPKEPSSEVGDRGLAKTLFTTLRDEVAMEPGLQLKWYLYAAWHKGKLEDASTDMERLKEKVHKRIEMVRQNLVKEQTRGTKTIARLVCLDVLALYSQNEEMESVVKEAENLLQEITPKKDKQ